jgi:hypothetical protein
MGQERWLATVFIIAACHHPVPPFVRVDSPELATQWCADDAMAAAQLTAVERDGVRLEYLPGTAAERDAAAILDHEIAARARIASALGVHDERTLVVRLAPSRAAAASHHIQGGKAFPEQARIEALYLDGEDTYEHVHYGHELTHVLAWRMDPSRAQHLRIIEEGLAEVFDQSGRDLDRELANQEVAAGHAPTQAIAFRDEDAAFAVDYAKAGSFMQTLLAIDPDPAKLAQFYKRSRWDRDLDAKSLSQLIDSNLAAVYGIRLAALQARWAQDLERAAARGPVLVPPEDAEQLAALVAFRDRAIANHDPALLRATVEGFYCDVVSDRERERRVRAMLATAPPGRSTLVQAFATAIKNYPTAILVIDRTQAGQTHRVHAFAERFPIGWRLVWVE